MSDTKTEGNEKFPSGRAVIEVTVLALFLLSFLVLIGFGYYWLQIVFPYTAPLD